MLRNMKLRTKLLLGFTGMAVITLVVGFLGYWGTNTISETTIKALKGDAKIAEHSARARANVLGMRRYEKDIIINHKSKDKVTDYFKKWKTEHDHLSARIADIEKVAVLDNDKMIIKHLKDELGKYDAGMSQVYGMIIDGKINSVEEGNKAIDVYKEAIHEAEAKAKDFAEEGEKRLGTIETSVATVSKQTSLILLILAVISIAVSMALGILITLSITRPVNRIIAGLSDGAQQVAAASGQVSSSSQQLAEGSSEQAASLEETSSSLEEITSMTKQNADHAQQAKSMMGEAQRIVENVNTNMQNMAEAIADVTKSSEETGKIIKTIDEIAFQTNLLALNAAVEAARAGEAGAGFAVVADEVRNLAMRAAEAAKNTNNLIENTIKSVRHGNELTKLTQDAFKENMEIAGKIGSLVDEIAAASQEQTHGIGEISKAVVEMDKVTQQTAANAEESASASEEMNAQAEQLNHFVRELTAVVGGKQNGVAVESWSEPLSKKLTGLVHINKKALPVPARGVAAKTSVTHRGKAVKSDQVIPMEEGQFKDF